MTKTKIKAEIVAHSLSPQGDELISILCTFPRIILAEVNMHRMLSKNTSSSRAIPFNKMVEAVQNDPFIPIAWQKDHKGMQGSEYITDDLIVNHRKGVWLQARDGAIHSAIQLNGDLIRHRNGQDEGKILEGTGVTKQLCNRLLEPFMWTTMLITGSREGWDNFHFLRNPVYEFNNKQYKSKKTIIKDNPINTIWEKQWEEWTDLDWLKINKGQAEIHMMALAECIYDAVNESTPKQLQAGDWHIPFGNKIDIDILLENVGKEIKTYPLFKEANKLIKKVIKVSVAMAARTSYTIVGEEKEVNYENLIALHDRLLTQEPLHSSPFEHCARAMSDEEYNDFIKGQNELYKIDSDNYVISYNHKNSDIFGWCYNLKGFISYRYLIDNKINL